MDKVYLVTKGRYSDYSVHGVFADKAIAEEYAAQITDKYERALVSERKLMTAVDLAAPIGFRAYSVLMDCDGNTDVDIDICEKNGKSYPDFREDTAGCWFIATGKYNFYVLTDKGKEGAIKIANERRIQMIAENKWPKKGDIIDAATLD